MLRNYDKTEGILVFRVEGIYGFRVLGFGTLIADIWHILGFLNRFYTWVCRKRSCWKFRKHDSKDPNRGPWILATSLSKPKRSVVLESSDQVLHCREVGCWRSTESLLLGFRVRVRRFGITICCENKIKEPAGHVIMTDTYRSKLPLHFSKQQTWESIWIR